MAFEQGTIGIPNDPALIGELQAYEGRDNSGYIRYSAPAGEHDDLVLALAITWGGLDAKRNYHAPPRPCFSRSIRSTRPAHSSIIRRGSPSPGIDMSTFYSKHAVFIRNVSWKASEAHVAAAFRQQVGGVEGVYLLPSKNGGEGHCGARPTPI